MEPDFQLVDEYVNHPQEDDFEDVEYLDDYQPSPPPMIPNKMNLLAIICVFFSFIGFCAKVVIELTKINSTSAKLVEKLKKENRRLVIALKSAVLKHRVNLDRNLHNFRKLFNDDQINCITKQLKRPAEWSDETILKGLQTKFACKKGGYNFLIREGYPLPSLVTLRKRLQGLDFEPGVLNEVFLFMKEKVKSFSAQERECELVIDEMAIIEGIFPKYFVDVCLSTLT